MALCIHADMFQAASPTGPGSRLSLPGRLSVPKIRWMVSRVANLVNIFLLPDIQVPSAELPRTEAQAEHAPARLHLASQSEPVKSSKTRTKTVNQPNLMEIFICLAVTKISTHLVTDPQFT